MFFAFPFGNDKGISGSRVLKVKSMISDKRAFREFK